MAEVLTTKEIALALENIIKRAEKYICIFTYNINIDATYLSRLRNAAKKGVKITIVFGVPNGKVETLESLIAMAGCDIYYKEYLHAKFFYNEKELLIGSMNLSEASEKNNFELGARFTTAENPTIIQKVKAEAREIIDDSIPWSNLQKSNLHLKVKKDVSIPVKGTCIRCSRKIELNPLRPLCIDCYHEWSEWENEYYQETVCHTCGKEKSGISFAKPECKACFKSKI